MHLRKYEVHNFTDKDVPVIFHHSCLRTVGAFSTNTGNWHENIELLYFLNGEGQVCCGGTGYAVHPGDLLVVNSNELHGFFSPGGMEYYCLIFDAAFLKANGLSAETICFETLVRSPEIAGLYLDVVKTLGKQEMHHMLALRARILLLFAGLIRAYAGEEKRRFAADKNVKLVIGYIKANYSRRLSLAEAAVEVGLDKCYLAREFKKATGMTLISYLNVVRCEKAKKLLETGVYSVGEVAQRCGYENASYFTRTFKSIMGCLPSEIGRQGR